MENTKKSQRWKNFRSLALKSLSLSVLLVMIFEVLPTLGEFWYTARITRNEASEYAHKEAIRLVQLAAHDHERLVANVQQLLSVLVEVPEIQSGKPNVCTPFLKKIQKQHPLYGNLGVIDLKGNVLCSALQVPPKTNLADRLYFTKALEKKSFAIGEFQIGRITKKPSLNFSNVVLDENKNVKYVIYVALDLSWLGQLANTAVLPTQATMMILDHKGFILARFPDSDLRIGKVIADQNILKAIRSNSDETVIESSKIDSLDRMFVFRKLRTAPEAGNIYLTVGVPNFVFYSQVEEMLNKSMSREAFVTFIEILFAWVAGFLFLYQIKKIQKAAKRLKAGDLTARTGLKSGFGELETLAHTFDDMASDLESRTREAEAGAKRLTFLSDSANQLCSSLDYKKMLKTVADLATPFMADFCAIDIFEEGNLIRVAESHVFPEKTALFRTITADPEQLSAPQLVTKITPEYLDESTIKLDKVQLKQLGVESLMVLPIKIHGSSIGSVIFASHRPDHLYQKSDLIIALDLTEYIGLAIENANLAKHNERQNKDFLS
ncbi:HAMP domain-containing protein [Bdellovibrio reynosensis]|uniref:HAMP domain-containing protein n=1 Tax=Bdellovibrio reynosensis TaxID=2835041 RepID=A0ABY4C8Y6_9BACT|nr:HAMP domain-containing protein [Bdellovibrio reynosensis]UOF01338.1 HAMP domain-containing protein [Bdellovibrio reynosensis]